MSSKIVGYGVLLLVLYIVYELVFGIYNFKFDHVGVRLGNNPIFTTNEEKFDVKLDLVGTFTTPVPFLGLGFHELDIKAKVVRNEYYHLKKRVNTVILPELDGSIDLTNIDFKDMMLMPSLAHQNKRTISITIKDINYKFLHDTSNFVYINGLVNGTSMNDVVTTMLDYYDVELTMSWMPSFYIYSLGEFYPSFIPFKPLKFLLSSIMNPQYIVYNNGTDSHHKTNHTLHKKKKTP
jgi:hypothetical protein